MHFCYRPPTNRRSSLEWILWFTQSRFTPAPAEIHLICIRGTHQSVSVSQLQTFAECYRRGEKSFQSHRLGLCSVTDRYPVLLDNRSILWKTAGIREKLASEHFWWNINKNRWVLVPNLINTQTCVSGMRNQSGTWGRTRCLSTPVQPCFLDLLQSQDHLQQLLGVVMDYFLFFSPPGSCQFSPVKVWKGRQQLSNMPASSSLIPANHFLFISYLFFNHSAKLKN